MTKNSKPVDLISMATDKLATLKVGNAYDTGKVNALSKSIKGRNHNLSADIHAAAVAAIYISMPINDGGSFNGEPARQLLNSISMGGVRAKTLTDWFKAFSNIRLSFDKTAKEYKVKLAKPGDDDYVIADPLKALAKPFWTVEEKTNGAQAFNIRAAIAKLLVQASKDGVSEADKAEAKAMATWARNRKLIDADNKPVSIAA